ncbi:MAG: hypothetical protein KBH23_04630 [Bacteroidaceae bacterium]|nr:hypothetical protein [Bacteroidaceae bacterium]
MSKKTYVSIILINLILLTPLSAQVHTASNSGKRVVNELLDTIPLFNGVYVGVDAVGMIGNMLGADTKGSEVQVDVNLRNRFFPVVEIGYSSTDSESDGGSHYTSDGSFFRLGMNYKMKFRNRDESHMFVGARYAFSSFKYDIESLVMTDPLWGGVLNPNLSDEIWGGSVPFSVKNQTCTAHWAELVLGVRVQIWENVMMGWSLRYKRRFAVSGNEQAPPDYVPGYGSNGSSTFGGTYSLIYKLPFKSKKK